MTSCTPPDPLPYHRLALRADRPRWWRPIVVLALGVVLFVAGAILLAGPLVLLGEAVPDLQGRIDDVLGDGDPSDPLAATYLLLAVALMLPAALLAVRLAGRRSPGTLSSVTGRLRWPLLVRCLGAALVLMLSAMLVMLTVEDGWSDAAVTDRTLPFLALAVLVVPLQAAAEEYVFRGVLMQTVGAWLRHPAFAIVLPVALFTLGHDYDVLGLIDVTAFGLAAGWLTWRTGGLEAAIGLHVATNALIFAFGGLGLVDLAATDGTPGGLVASLAVTGLFTWLVRDWADAPSYVSAQRQP
ncbi:CPBP family intramembrane glutamic endopeptidase [Pimelobacter simplex]|uniref:CPBP family intramembrane glutamic endopeptidase n=1 Tax=Nocardioides simplex TaxID=2045 RepID=UPI00137631DD|nr:CPBP family intramembrane glutamic endopeptidase [Pimelobacter simplex]